MGLALALTPLASAQQFQTPTLPNPLATAVSQHLQARLQHAQALKSQMLRAQYEQGASSDFAKKAYDAQQAYQAERAFDEYTAYLKLQNNREQFSETNRPEADLVPNFTPIAYQPLTQATEFTATPILAPNRQSTFSPPVHIAPSPDPSFASFGNKPKEQEDELNQTQSRDLKQVEYQEHSTQQIRSKAQPLYAYQPPRAGVVHSTQSQFSSQQQLATPQRMISSQSSILNSTRPQPQQTYRKREYILSENSREGLQDRIASMFSKSRFRETNANQPQLAPKSQVESQPIAPTTQSVQQRFPPRQSTQNPGQRRWPDGTSQANLQSTSHQIMAGANQVPQVSPTHPTRLPSPTVPMRSNGEVQHAFEMQQRRARTNSDRTSVQHAAMVEPVQDPFNDQSVALSPSSIQTAQLFYEPIPLTGPNQQEHSSPKVDENTPMRQISVLSNRSQDADQPQDNQFGQPLKSDTNQQPAQDFLPQSPEDQKQADEEFDRRLQELEGNQGDESARIDDMVRELEKELEKSRADQTDSVLDQNPIDEFDNQAMEDTGSFKSNLTTCDEFRNVLLNNSIRDIALDMSPLASRNRGHNASMSRTWTDRAGNIVATGSMVDLRRGYVIIDTADGRQKISYAKLSDADWAAVSRYWKIPELCSVGDQGNASHNWIPQTYTWKASSLCHKPLFFENIQLERYGHTHGPFTQPIRSVAHFFVSLVSVPYQSGIHPAYECQYALGFYRPGDCAPWLKDPIPISLNGAVRQALFTTGVAVIQ